MDAFSGGGSKCSASCSSCWRSPRCWSTVKIVPQGMNYTVERFGRYTRTLQPGSAHPVPVMERVGRG